MSADSKTIIAAAIFQAGEPLATEALMRLFLKEDRPTKPQLLQYLAEIKEDYSSGPVELKEVASGYRFQVRSEYAEPISRLQLKKPPKYSRATLETLALIIYKQPITRGEIEQVRGVAVSSSIIKALTERDWIRVVGYKDVPGKPAMFATTKTLLDYFNVASLSDFPPLDDIVNLEETTKEVHQQLSLNVDPTDDDLAVNIPEEEVCTGDQPESDDASSEEHLDSMVEMPEETSVIAESELDEVSSVSEPVDVPMEMAEVLDDSAECDTLDELEVSSDEVTH